MSLGQMDEMGASALITLPSGSRVPVFIPCKPFTWVCPAASRSSRSSISPLPCVSGIYLQKGSTSPLHSLCWIPLVRGNIFKTLQWQGVSNPFFLRLGHDTKLTRQLSWGPSTRRNGFNSQDAPVASRVFGSAPLVVPKRRAAPGSSGLALRQREAGAIFQDFLRLSWCPSDQPACFQKHLLWFNVGPGTVCARGEESHLMKQSRDSDSNLRAPTLWKMVGGQRQPLTYT